MSNRNRACIVGIGESQYAKWGTIKNQSEFSLACEAILAAARDAGISPKKIDGFASFSYDRNEPGLLMSALGIEKLRFTGMVWGGGGGGSCGSVALAKAAVESGQANYVVVFRALCQGQSFRFGQFHPWTEHVCFTAPFGMLAPPQMFAPLVRRHMHLYGTQPEHFGEVALSCRVYANRNPRAVMYGQPLTMNEYLSSRMISDPLRLYDCCLESDGAAALLVTTWERAQDLRARPVDILAAQQGSGYLWGTGLLGGHNMPSSTYASANAAELAEDLYSRAGVLPKDIDVVQFYDAFTGMVLFALEDFGFCGIGESGDYVAEGNLRFGGASPCNTSGGILSEAYIHGLNLVVEGVRQVRGESSAQINDASLVLISGGESVTPTSGLILGG